MIKVTITNEFITNDGSDYGAMVYHFSTLPTAAAPHTCLTFGQKWRSIELCRSDRIILSIRNEESRAETIIIVIN